MPKGYTMLNQRENERRRNRIRRREYRKKMRRRRNTALGILAAVMLLLSARFVVSKLNDNSNAMSASTAAVSPRTGGDGSFFNDVTTVIESSSNESRMFDKPVSFNVTRDKKQTEGFGDTLDCFLVTNQDAVLYNRDSAKSFEVAVLPKGTYVETYGRENGWTKVTSIGREGYIRNRELDVVEDPNLFRVVDGHMIVNAKYGLDPSYKTVFNEKAASALRVMMEAMERDGLTVEVGAKYRDAAAEAQELVLRGNPADAPAPGHSAFQTGCAVQFYTPGTDPRIDNKFEDTAQFRWLKEHAAEYGFILRYPEGSESVTGYRADPTIFFYVGVSDAEAITAAGVTMDEYYANR